MIRVGVSGACGRMGREVCKTVVNAPDTQLVFAVDPKCEEVEGLVAENDLEKAFSENPVDALVDFTAPEHALKNALITLESRAVPIIGTSGLDKKDLDELKHVSEESGIAVFYVPNFAIGAVLMMKYARETAKYFPNVEIIELHHNKKADAPSGTAMQTVEEILKNRTAPPDKDPTEFQKMSGARGGEKEGVHVHSVRLPGLLAHQEVIFGGPGEVLTIRHDSLSRESFMQGVLFALRNYKKFSGLVVGLESMLD
jgi:4-hydroxy-tetrahydrodipicolinate reductase